MFRRGSIGIQHVFPILFFCSFIMFAWFASSSFASKEDVQLVSIRLYKGQMFILGNEHQYVLTNTNPACETCEIDVFYKYNSKSHVQCIEGSQIMIGSKLYIIGAINLNFVDFVEYVGVF